MAIMDTGWLDSLRCFLEDVGGGKTIPPYVLGSSVLLFLRWWRGGEVVVALTWWWRSCGGEVNVANL